VDSIRIEPYQPEHARPLVELWRASFEYGVGIKDSHPLEDQLAFFEAKVLPENTVRIALSASGLVGFIASTPESVAQLYEPDAAAEDYLITAYRERRAPGWLTAALLPEVGNRRGYDLSLELLLDDPGLDAASYAAQGMLRIDRERARRDLLQVICNPEIPARARRNVPDEFPGDDEWIGIRRSQVLADPTWEPWSLRAMVLRDGQRIDTSFPASSRPTRIPFASLKGLGLFPRGSCSMAKPSSNFTCFEGRRRPLARERSNGSARDSGLHRLRARVACC
jgi:hypothetical protein